MFIKNKFDKFIKRNRLIFLLLFLFSFLLIPLGISTQQLIYELSTPDEVNIIDESVYSEYYDSLNESRVDMDLIFDWPCSGEVTVNFFDINEELISTETEDFSTYGERSSYLLTFYNVPGEVYEYEIVSINIVPDQSYLGEMLCIFVPIIFRYLVIFCFSTFLVLFIFSFFLKCNIYQFEKKEIVVYAGWKTNQIFENGTLMDELITWNKRGAIEIGYTDEYNNVIEARIGSHNHITLKINNKIYSSKTR